MAAILALACAAAVPAVAQARPQLQLVSVAAGGGPADSAALIPAVSSSGRWVAFYSRASNLVAGDRNGATDVFERDLLRHRTRLVSVAGDGAQGNDESYLQSVSANGSRVAFFSIASNLVPGDTNGTWDMFVRDVRAGTTVRADVTSEGAQAPAGVVSSAGSLSPDGRYVSFDSYSTVLGPTGRIAQVFVHDLRTGITRMVSTGPGGHAGNCASTPGGFSADDRLLVFQSCASNLVPGDTNGRMDVFVRDLRTGVTRRVSVATSGAQAAAGASTAAISADGRTVTFLAEADLTGASSSAMAIYVHDMRTGVTTRLRTRPLAFGSYALSGNGRVLVYAGTRPAGGIVNAFYRIDLRSGRRAPVVLPPDPAPSANLLAPSLDGDGDVLAFWSTAAELAPPQAGRAGDVWALRLGG